MGVEVLPTDRRLTEDYVLDAVRAVLGGPIALDVCTERDNPTGALLWLYPEAHDSRDLDWSLELAYVADRCEHHAGLWMNPPFSDPLEWAERWAAVRGTAFAFTGVDFTTDWWGVLCEGSVLRTELKRRPRCIDPATGVRMDVARSGAVWLRTDDQWVEHAFRREFRRHGRISAMAA